MLGIRDFKKKDSFKYLLRVDEEARVLKVHAVKICHSD